MRRSTAIRLAACTALAAGFAAPLVRRRLRLPPPVVTATAASAPFALCVLVPRSRKRDVAVVVLQMWAYVATYQMPNDDPAALERRVLIDYPVRVDRFIGRGVTPTLRLQRAFGRPGHITAVERTLIWSHWIWFLVPHGTALYLLLRHREQLPARRVPALRDVRPRPDRLLGRADRAALVRGGARPDGRRAHAGAAADDVRVRRAVLEVQLAADVRFPRREPARCHAFAAFRLVRPGRPRALGDRPVAGAIGWAYATTLGVALVYLGEHYVVDLAAGLTLTEAVRRAAPLAAPLFGRVAAGVQALEAKARG